MLSAEENDLLCRVEGDAPMGQIMRRHWLPACLSEEVAERDSAPVRVRLLGEDLVAFRDSEGGWACSAALPAPPRLARARAQRGVRSALPVSRLENRRRGQRRWRCRPSRADSRFEEKVKHKSYPVHEAAGLVWVYMGPAEEMPPFEPPAFRPRPTPASASSRSSSSATGRRCWRARSIPRIPPTLHASDMVPARVEGAKATDQRGRGLRPTRRRGCRCSARRSVSAMPRSASPIVNEATHMYVRTRCSSRHSPC